MKIRLITLFLALSLLLTLTACTGGGDAAETDTEAGTAAGTDAADTSDTAGAPAETDTEPAGTAAADTAETPTEAPTETQGEAAGDGPVITLASTDAITVKAGETVTLPAATVKDTNGRDISSWLEVSDNAEPDAVNGDTFCGSIAGKHTVYYFVENADGKIAEAFLTVNVEGAYPNTFDAQGLDDCENMKDYKDVRDGFENGRKSTLYAGLGDAGRAVHLSSAADEAIEGNSLVVDFARSAGASETAIFFNGFNDYFHRNMQATYRVTFSYKLVEADGNFGDIYIGLSWDGSTGINRQFIPSDAVLGEVYTYTAEFPAAIVPEGGNAYFFLFKLNKTDKPIVVSFDNFVIETVELKQVASVVPTVAELEQGFTWDFTTNGAVCTNGQTESVDSLPADIKAALSGREGFGTNVMHLTNADDHLFSGLTEKNLTPGKVLTIDIEYYAVSDRNFYLIMMGRSGNPTQTVTNTADGSFHTVHLETRVQSGWYQLNIYGQNNPGFDIYIGKITVRVADAGAQDANKTVNGHEFGMTFSQDSREFGLIDDDTLTLAAYDGYDFGADAAKMGDAPTKFTFKNTNERVIEWFRTNGKMENGYRYEITVTYYVVDFKGPNKMTYCFDRGAFPLLGEGNYMTPGFHETTVEWTADRDVDFFCFYLGGSGFNGTLYLKDVTVKLLGK